MKTIVSLIILLSAINFSIAQKSYEYNGGSTKYSVFLDSNYTTNGKIQESFRIFLDKNKKEVMIATFNEQAIAMMKMENIQQQSIDVYIGTLIIPGEDPFPKCKIAFLKDKVILLTNDKKTKYEYLKVSSSKWGTLID